MKFEAALDSKMNATGFWGLEYGLQRGGSGCGPSGERWFVAALLIAMMSGIAGAQASAPPAKDPSIYTLHVYTNLLQVAALVLGPSRESLKKPIAASRFAVSIDGGTWFPATHVRPEGDDPMTLSILLDLSGETENLIPKMEAAIADLAPDSLRARDRISIYSLDCALVRSLKGGQGESASLHTAVARALQEWKVRKETHGRKCKQSIHLLDAIGAVATEMRDDGGRKVILVVSDGDDKDSKNSWNGVGEYASYAGIAIFGMSDEWQFAGRPDRFRATENLFNSLCELTGGELTSTTPHSLSKSMKAFVVTVRQRYIIEFPRSSNSTAGRHSLDVKIDKGGGYFLRSTGVTAPLMDPAVLKDPSTVSVGPKETPEQGQRKILTPR